MIQERTGTNDDESTLRDTEQRGLKGVEAEALDDKSGEVRDAAVGNLKERGRRGRSALVTVPFVPRARTIETHVSSEAEEEEEVGLRVHEGFLDLNEERKAEEKDCELRIRHLARRRSEEEANLVHLDFLARDTSL